MLDVEFEFAEAKTYGVLAVPFGGYLLLECQAGYLTSLDFSDHADVLEAPENAVMKDAKAQLSRYFVDPQTSFSLPLRFSSTVFRHRVWEHLRHIPPGQTETYGSLAKQLASSARAIGGACRHNPLPIVIPCHRVCGSQGIGGFSGFVAGRSIEIKNWLLAHERRIAR